MSRLILWVPVLLLLAVSPALADDNQWLGIKTSVATSLSENDVEDTTLWSLGWVPAAGDRAYFDFDDTTGAYWEDLVIGPASSLAPDNWYQGASPWNGDFYSPVYLLKDLEITDMKFVYGYSSGGQSDEVLRIGASDIESRAWLQMSSADVAAVDGVTNISGPLGNADVDLTGLGGFKNDIVIAINAVTETTGVMATTSWTEPIPSGGIYIYADPDPNNPSVDPVITFTPSGGATFTTSRYGHADPDNSATGYHAQSVTLTVTGALPWDYTEGNGSDPRNICMARDSKMVFNNAAVVLQQQNQTPSMNAGPGHSIAGTGGAVEFPAVEGSVQLDDPGVRLDGNLRMGDHTLALRSDQTWTNTSGMGFIRTGLLSYIVGDAAHSPYGRVSPPILAALDGQPLNNLGDVPVFIDGNTRSTQNRELGVACTLQSLNIDYYDGSSTQTVRLSGDTVLTGGIVIPGDPGTSTPVSIDTDWSLKLHARHRNKSYVDCQGNNLTMANGMYLDRSTGTDFAYGRGAYVFKCQGSTVAVGGDIKLEDVEGNPGILGVGLGNPRMGIDGGGSGGSIVCSGSYWTNCGPMTDSGLYGLTASTLTMLGDGKTLECMGDPVGDPNVDDFGAGTSAIGTLNIGDPNTAANITLADDNVNDAGGSEVLLVGTLNIVNGTLDCNGLGAKIGPATLSIAAGGTLDLNSGQVLSAGVPYTAVFGIGDQADAWNAVSGTVMDSDNPGESFEAVYVGDDDKTYWQIAAGGDVLDIDAALDWNWVYQNTETTTADKHVSTLTITLVSEAQPGETYTVAIDEGAGPGLTNFTAGTAQVVGDTLVVSIIGGRAGTTTANAPGTATLTVTVTGDSSAKSDSDSVTLQLRKLGDLDGSGGDPVALDKQNFNKCLNGVATGLPDRAFDLNAADGANAVDKQIMNNLLNGVVLP